ncbi:MAG: RNA-binding S4 domain-containing protein [Planctomycetota bacterium]
MSDDPGQPSSQPVMRLDDLIKRSGLVGSGGQAKLLIQDGQVSVNGEIETRRRKQLQLGDVIEFLDQQITLDESFFDSDVG